jgi:hypothetical protein
VLEHAILGFNTVNEAEGTKGAACTRKERKSVQHRTKEAMHQQLRKISVESKQGMVGSKTNRTEGS